jgi:hypothetical protein
MSQLAGTTFGIGTPTTYPMPPIGWSAQQPFLQPQPMQSIGYGIGVAPPPQQIVQLLQIVAQQLQQVQALEQQQLVHLQQLLQLVPAQLQQLQQLVQIVPQQVHHLQQGQPFGQGFSGQLGAGLPPQVFAGQPIGQVM